MTNDAKTLEEDVSAPVEEAAWPARTARPENLELARRVKRLMEVKGWTPSELARRSGTTKQIISNMNLGYSRPKLGTLIRIAQTLGVPISHLDPELDGVTYKSINLDDALSATQAPGRPGYMVLVVNKVVRSRTALEVQRLLLDDDKATDDQHDTAVG